MNPPPWYVITGGPCAGKTTLILELAHRGYRTVSESARAYIEAEQAKGHSLKDIRADEVGFQHALIPMKVLAEQEAPRDTPTFFDRGMHDSSVYLALAGIVQDEMLEAALANSHYAKAFLPDLLPFKEDDARTENAEEARRIHAMLRTAYEEASVPLIAVPVMPVSKRVDFILAHL